MTNITWRPFHCLKCDYHFEYKTDVGFAPPCTKCRDSEYVNHGYSLPNEINMVPDLSQTKLEAVQEPTKELELMPDEDKHLWPYI